MDPDKQKNPNNTVANISNKTESKKNRCVICDKSLGILFFKCKCDPDIKLCTKHRYPEDHKCTYDYVTEGKEKLKKLNPGSEKKKKVDQI